MSTREELRNAVVEAARRLQQAHHRITLGNRGTARQRAEALGEAVDAVAVVCGAVDVLEAHERGSGTLGPKATCHPSVVRSLVEEIRRLRVIRDAVKRLRVAARCEDICAIGPAVFDLGDTLDAYEQTTTVDGDEAFETLFDAKEGG